jgi:hypothetical protein
MAAVYYMTNYVTKNDISHWSISIDPNNFHCQAHARRAATEPSEKQLRMRRQDRGTWINLHCGSAIVQHGIARSVDLKRRGHLNLPTTTHFPLRFVVSIWGTRGAQFEPSHPPSHLHTSSFATGLFRHSLMAGFTLPPAPLHSCK